MAKQRRQRRVRLGASEDQHQKRGNAFALEALRTVEKVKSAPDCRTALERLGRAQRAYGGAIAETSAVTGAPTHLRAAVQKIGRGLDEAHAMVAGRCLR